MRLAVYSVLFGRYESLIEQPVAASYGAHLVMFTDDPDLRSETWEVRYLAPRLPGDPARSSRWPKVFPHRLFPDHDVSLYIDNLVLLKRDPATMANELLPPESDMASIRHGWRTDVLDEAAAVERLGLDAPWLVAEQLRHYAASDPESLRGGLLSNGVMLRRHHAPGVMAVMDRWWDQILRYSRRDQLSLPWCLRAEGLQPLVHELDNFDNDWWQWPIGGPRVARPPLNREGPPDQPPERAS
jgi:hypothetical protein